MIDFKTAIDLVLKNSWYEPRPEIIDFSKSLNRILAEDVYSDIDMPPFNKAAMDGYACKRADLPNELQVVETIPAGKVPEKIILKNQCAKIMTGAMVPEGADCVFRIEDSSEQCNGFVRFTGNNTRDNFVKTGEDISTNEKVLVKGTLIQPQHIAVMATVGYTKATVSKKLIIGIISTGDELVEPGFKPAISQIRNSNAFQLMAQIEKTGCKAIYSGIIKDDFTNSKETILNLFGQCQIILLTGGVSMGDYDFIPGVLKDIGVDIKFKSIAVQPGRPTVFGIKDNTYIFGLPGNPVSSFNIFELLVKPLIYKVLGHNFQPVVVKMPLGISYSRSKSNRLSFLPVRLDNKMVFPVTYHGSAHINALINAFGLISIDKGTNCIKEGEMVVVRQI